MFDGQSFVIVSGKKHLRKIDVCRVVRAGLG